MDVTYRGKNYLQKEKEGVVSGVFLRPVSAVSDRQLPLSIIASTSKTTDDDPQIGNILN